MSTLAELKERKAARDAARQADADAREIAELELEEKLSETGNRGIDFEIVNTEIGLFAVRKPEFIVAKKFNAIPADKKGEEDAIAFVGPCMISPEPAIYRAAFMAHGGVAWRCAVACLALYHAQSSERVGKY